MMPSESAVRLGAIQHLSSLDQSLFSRFCFGEKQTPSFQCIHEAFEHHVRIQPDAIAVDDFGDQITYTQLDHQSSCLAVMLRARGASQAKPVCLLMERSIYMIVGILAVLKAGAAYLPLDGTIVKDETLRHVLRDSSCGLVLSLQKFAERVRDVPVICIEDAICQHEGCRVPSVERRSSTDDLCYIIYTSGTTGMPKGVTAMHRGVMNLLCLWPGNLGMRPGLRVAQIMNLAFDMGAWEILGSLINGCTLVLRGKTSEQWRATMKRVDIVIATPSMLARHDPLDYPDIKVVAVGGEPCPQALADNWARSTQFFNVCGPTEITIANTLHPHIPGQPLSIGTPTPNNNVYILDDYMQPVPIGDVGLMWAGGVGVSRGYLNLPDKTAERFHSDPFVVDCEDAMMFNTGDLGRWNPEGRLEHYGRIDDQVKIKGFRVELDGVSAAMRECKSVKSAVALCVDGILYGFVTPCTVDVEEVRAAVAAIQPYYAIPKHLFAVDEFPLTPNGKVAKAVLRQLAVNLTRLKEQGASVEETDSSSSPDSNSESNSETQSVSTAPTTPSLIYPHDNILIGSSSAVDHDCILPHNRAYKERRKNSLQGPDEERSASQLPSQSYSRFPSSGSLSSSPKHSRSALQSKDTALTLTNRRAVAVIFASLVFLLWWR